MTKRLEELFELPTSDESILEDTPAGTPQELIEREQDALSNLDKIDKALPTVRGLEASDNEMDELSELAVNSFKDLQELAMQVEARFSSEIFQAASSMLGHAITAKTAKMNKKLKMIELQLKKAQLDSKNAAKEEVIDNMPLGEGKSLDRNELLKILATKTKE